MKDLIAQLIEKVNLTEEQASQAAETVKNFLSDKLPDALRGPVEAALSGEALQDAAEKAKDFIGGMFGKE